MDLGGASTQIAFAVTDDLTGPDYLPVKLYGYPYNVYTHSFLCYGKNEAEKRILDKVLQVCSFLFHLFFYVCEFTEVLVSIIECGFSHSLYIIFFKSFCSGLNAHVRCKWQWELVLILQTYAAKKPLMPIVN